MTEIREYPKMKDIYGSLVFDQREMKQRLPRDVFDSLIAAMESRATCSTVSSRRWRDGRSSTRA